MLQMLHYVLVSQNDEKVSNMQFDSYTFDVNTRTVLNNFTLVTLLMASAVVV